ncbi:DNA topoisomerase IV subunit A [Spiroplasma endosymbiont of Crioceris asparagi]|uniref:DNA topoisomerase IV subunit A n=1 Tax=Spiroplasma endosymbiont of Crioceris asparagi TaxID=3066286 RepID=UPI0030D3435C
MAKKNKQEEIVINEEIIEYNLDELMEDRFGRYAKYIIQERALPDVRDGLKPVQRRILYTMNEINLFYDKAYKKSARVVGEVIGKYHPHGDTSIYEALVRMSQSWKLNMPLVDMHGNNGSIDGDSAAAMRYTEARLAKVSNLLLNDLKKDSVLFAPNFDDSEVEPTVLPSYFPNILVNGSTGIAAGYATNIPPHNFSEIVEATIKLIENPNTRVDSLAKIIKGPDFPTGGVAMGKAAILESLKTGRGKIILQSKIHIEDQNIIIDEIPYEIVKQDLVRKIGEAIDNNPQMEIKDIRDETDRNGLRIVIELSKKANIDVVRKWLLKNTPLQVSYNYNNVVIVDKRPKLLGTIEIIKAYIKHLKEVFLKKTRFDLAKAEKRLEIVKGLIKAVDILDDVIHIIRKSTNRNDAIENLMSKHKFSNLQASSIVDLRLYRLTSTDVKKLIEEKTELSETIKKYKKIINDESVLDKELIDLLTNIKAEYGIPRRTQIEAVVENIEVNYKDTIVEKDYKIWISKDGYLKALEKKYVEQTQLSAKDFGRKPYDMWISTVELSSLDNLILVCSNGTYYMMPVYKITPSKWKDIGMHINKVAPFDGENKIVGVFALKSFENAQQEILLCTKNGMIKRTMIEDLETKSFNRAIKIMNLGTGDEVVSASLVTSKTKYVLVLTKSGFAVRYSIWDIPVAGTNAKGVKGTAVKEDIIGGKVFEENAALFLITDKGNYKKISQDAIPIMARPKRGVRVYQFKKTGKPESAIAMFNVIEKDIIDVLNTDDEINSFNVRSLRMTDLGTKTVELKAGSILNAILQKSFVVVNGDKPSNPNVNKGLTANFGQADFSNIFDNDFDALEDDEKDIDELKTADLKIDLDDILD